MANEELVERITALQAEISETVKAKKELASYIPWKRPEDLNNYLKRLDEGYKQIEIELANMLCMVNPKPDSTGIPPEFKDFFGRADIDEFIKNAEDNFKSIFIDID